jgi:DNA-directed RNA polymerase specialized sigma24 family protein
MMQVDGTLYTRYEHGSLPVRVQEKPDGRPLYLLEREHKVQEFPSARQLLITVTGHKKARNWTWNRYFHLGRHAPPLSRVETSFDIFDLLDPECQQALTVAPAVLHKLGIDLQHRGREVAKLLFAGFGARIYAEGWDVDDVLQEVYKGILARNEGSCPWDERRSSFGHYVHMVCRCVVSNYARKQRRRQQVEQVGMRDWRDGELVEVDVATAAHTQAMPTAIPEALAEEDFRVFLLQQDDIESADGVLAVHVLPLVRAGHTRAEIADIVGLSKAAVSRALAFLRAHARQWVL